MVNAVQGNNLSLFRESYRTKIQTVKKKTLRGFDPLANYADRATAAYWISSAKFCG
jgi:hypothetical protein